MELSWGFCSELDGFLETEFKRTKFSLSSCEHSRFMPEIRLTIFASCASLLAQERHGPAFGTLSIQSGWVFDLISDIVYVCIGPRVCIDLS